MKNPNKKTLLLSSFAFLAIGLGFGLLPMTTAFAEHNVTKEKTHGEGFPKTVYYTPRGSDDTRFTVAQCDSPEQCKEVNGTPSANLASKKTCEEFSGPKCEKVKPEE